MNYSSQFAPEDSEIMFQRIDALRAFFSESALFLLEEMEEERPTVKLRARDTFEGVVKVFSVEATADDLQEAVELACDVMKKLRRKASKEKNYYPEAMKVSLH